LAELAVSVVRLLSLLGLVLVAQVVVYPYLLALARHQEATCVCLPVQLHVKGGLRAIFTPQVETTSAALVVMCVLLLVVDVSVEDLLSAVVLGVQARVVLYSWHHRIVETLVGVALCRCTQGQQVRVQVER
jgi:hypothetical protein